MRSLILAAAVALAAAPVYAATLNGDTGQVTQPYTATPPSSGSSGTAGNAGDLPSPGAATSTAQTNAGGQAGVRTGGATPDVNKTQ